MFLLRETVGSIIEELSVLRLHDDQALNIFQTVYERNAFFRAHHHQGGGKPVGQQVTNFLLIMAAIAFVLLFLFGIFKLVGWMFPGLKNL